MGAQSRWLRGLNLLALLGLVVATAALLLRPSDDDGLLGLPELVAGGRAPRTVKAPRDFIIADPVTTDRVRAEAVQRQLPTYDVVTTAGLAAKTKLEQAFADLVSALRPHTEAGAAAAGAAPKPHALDRAAIEGFMRALELYLDELEVETVVKGGFADPVRDGAIMVVRTIHEQRIVEDRDLLRVQAPSGVVLRVLDAAGHVDHEEQLADVRAILGIDQAKATIDEVVAEHLAHLSAEERRSVALLTKRLLRPNTIANPEETALRRARARDSVREMVVPIKRGDVVVRGGEVVTERHLLVVRGMAAALEAESRYQRPIGSALLAILLVVLAYRQARGRSFQASSRDLGLMTATYLATLLVTWLAYKGALAATELMPSVPSSAWRVLVPVATGPLLLRFLIGRAPAEAFAALSAVTTALMMDSSLDYAVLVLAGSLAATQVPVDVERPQLGVLAGGVMAGLTQGAAVSVLALLGSRWTLDVVQVETVFALSSGLLSALVVLIAVPLADVLLGYTTPVRMRELSSLNHPLLRDLLVQAPGTYHHSIVVGALAEAAARVIGADAVLARVGGYYHDIGKLKNPRMFLENRRPSARSEGEPFVELSPVLVEDEASMCRHVGDGLELGAKHRLGAAVLEILEQHHGTRELRSLGRTPRTGRPEPAAPELRYPGPVPRSREAALVMIADAVEVAADALVGRGPIEEGTLDGLVSRIVREAVAESQLDASPLTLADLAAVEREMARVLREMLMRRGGGTSVRWTEAAAPTVYVVPPSPGRPN